MANYDTAEAYYNRPACCVCGGLATQDGGRCADECTCEHGSCEECGAPYASAAQQTAVACSQCNDQAEAWFAELERQAAQRPTVEVPVIEDFWAEGARRMGVRS